MVGDDGHSVLHWVGVTSEGVCLVMRLGLEERSTAQVDDARQLARARSARGEITAEEVDALRLLVQV